jgi:hypothetical protein
MRGSRLFQAAVLALMLSALGATAEAQGKGQGSEKGKAQAAEARGNAKAQGGRADAAGQGNKARAAGQQGRGNDASRGNSQGQGSAGQGRSDVAPGRVVRDAAGSVERGRGRWARDLGPSELRPAIRPLVSSDRVSHRLAGKAVGLAHARGVDDRTLVVNPSGDRVIVRNRNGQVLLDMDDERARNLGAWRTVTLDDRVRAGSPAFCRSGAGHPVWGRQWCLDKGFGLGSQNNVRWGRTVDPIDVVLGRRAMTGDLTRDVLLGVLGNVAFNRLATHALTLGYTDPLTGRWMGEPSGPQVLLVSSGQAPVAELVDVNRDGRADLMYVGLRSW